MQSRIWAVLLVLLLVLTGFNAGYLLGQSPWAPFNAFNLAGAAPADAETAQPFWEAWNLVHERYYDQPVDDAVLIDGAIEGMLATLGDQHTRYLPPADEARSQEQMDGEFQGIGVVVEDVEGRITVISPIDGSPAEAAGLQPGDVLIEADGVDLAGMDLTEAAGLIRGSAGTSVNLVVDREGERLTFDIVRDIIKVPSVSGEMLDNGIGYVRITQFIRTTRSELATTLDELMAQNPQGIVLDLRRNPGGLLDQVTDVADQFLPAGVVLYEEFAGGQRRVYETSDRGTAEDVPMVVLIDEGSASAAEVLAGAIRDRDRGILIGVKSFGKGTVQSVHTLSNGGGLRLTIAKWLTPDEGWVNGEGLTPDVEVGLPEDITPAELEANDPQLQAAVDYLQGLPMAGSPAVEPGQN
jgi:carboxyl-terminal processing protease